MKPKATSKEAILAVCRTIVREQGLAGISARSVASACGIAPGTLYNYFPDKDAPVLAVTEDVWSDVFGRTQQDVSDGAEKPDGEQPGSEKPGGSEGILAYVEKTFSTARAGLSRYPGFLPAHVLGLAAEKGQGSTGRAMMRAFFERIQNGVLHALNADHRVREDAFSGALTREAFAELVTQQLLVQLILGRDDCAALLAMVEKIAY